MQKRFLMGVDIGTSETKGTLTDLEGHICATTAVPHDIISPEPGFAEHDPINTWMNDIKTVVAGLLDKVRGKPEEIACIGISTVMAAVTIVDKDCNPLRNAILYGIDTRCTKQAEKLNDLIGRDTWKKTFDTECTIEHFGPKILWIKENEPELFAKAEHITFASGFINARLTGNYFVDKYSASSALPMFNPVTKKWDEKFCRYICPEKMLPEIAESTYSVIGAVTDKAAEETGLAAGTKVICGTTDAGAEAVSVGVVNPGDTMLMYGSTAFYIHVSDKILKGSKIWGADHTIDQRYVYTGGMATTGSLTKWIRNEFCKDLLTKEKQEGLNAYALMSQEAENIPAGSNGLIILPYFQGERMPLQDPLAKGVFFGMTLEHKRAHIIHAVYEGIGYGIDQNLCLLRKAGLDLGEITAVGGGTKSPLWIQIVSNICNINQKVPEITVGASYGDALLAGLAMGTIQSPDEIKKLVKIKYTVKPDKKQVQVYEKMKTFYGQLYQRNKDLMHELW